MMPMSMSRAAGMTFYLRGWMLLYLLTGCSGKIIINRSVKCILYLWLERIANFRNVKKLNLDISLLMSFISWNVWYDRRDYTLVTLPQHISQ